MRSLSIDSSTSEEEEAEQKTPEEEFDTNTAAATTYVCELHDPKPILIAEHVRHNRIDISPVDGLSPRKNKRSPSPPRGSSSDSIFQYEISIGQAHGVFECTPAKVLDVYKTLSKERHIVDQLRFIETNYFREGLLGSLKRMYTSPCKLSEEIIEVLESISDIDAVLLHPAYLELIGAPKGSEMFDEIENLLQFHNRTPRSDPASKCMCGAFHRCIDRFGEFYSHQTRLTDIDRFSTVVSESLMRAHRVLAFYPDTVYVVDKREFRATRGLKKCSIYGFGRRKLFEIVQLSRKEWSFRHFEHGPLFKLSLERYIHRMNPQYMVAIKRLVPEDGGGLREECVCFLRKSKSMNGYRCLLMSEVISRGRRTTAITIERAPSAARDQHYHYITKSAVSGATTDSIVSSRLSVPMNPHKHLQRLHVTGGSDVLTFLALAASYDILVGAISFWMDKRY
ncbi:TPA: hypothetical protein N0F65_006383 [Lagenidium giganteum]|uniref:Uncharacterized protein n=1 Tax=Lagenidium giganteum TaxID=4803 RepID=A0AAV2YXP9_9STRA|nr:TPA: hypothetical protein N0F65_006383 [Lagenidium giganteum]